MNADLADLHFQGDSGWVMLAVSSAETRESMQVVFPQSARFKGGKMLETRSRPVRLAVMVFVCCTEAECVFFFLPFTRAWIRTLGKVALWGKLDCFIINQNIPPTAQYAFLPFWRVFTFRRAQLP